MTTETAPAVALPGGEMLSWSDQRGETGNDPLAALAARLVPAGARVLLAGPHDPALLDALTHARITCLLRGYPDAAAVAGRVDRVLVAGPHGLPPGEEYDVVIAAGGLDAVESVEGARLGWDAALARLVAAVRPGGQLLLRLDNPLGVHRLVAATGWYAGRDDAEWTVGGVLDAHRPANLDQLRVRLAATGMRAGASYAAYPRPDLTTALLATDQLARRTSSGLFDAVLHDACTSGFGGRFVLADPARLAVDALHAGRAAELAPSWLVLAHRTVDSSATDERYGTAAVDRDGLPVALVQAGGPGNAVVEVVDGPQGWSWHRPDPGDRTEAASAPYASREVAFRDPAAPDGPVPDGRLLRSLLLDGCLRRDTTLLRRLLRGYADWLANQADDGRLTGAVALAGADNLVVAGDRFAVLDPTWRANAPLPVDVVLARTLWRFSAELLTGGYAHPWTSTLDVAGLTVVLGGVAGWDFDRAVVDAAVETEAAIGAAVRGLDADGRVGLDAELRAVTPTDPPPGPGSYQQLREAWLRQQEENTRLTALLKWTEDLLTSRERALRRAEAAVDLLSGSLSYKVGRLAITPARLAKRGARAAKRRATAAIAQRQQDRPDKQEQQ
ncbi:class I SAM-dependent methyltransferase [Micromonospora sp. NPDC051296]|uniref:class I SAM-dependent methyltransferase n=1 Tax=Micromonospora sp. NPDC051296 TaxID=3155046 RepID=UPI0034400607